jgi:acetyl coenzyme A synthetase (ADP forming)-like protein
MQPAVEADVVLRDGSTVHVRGLRPSDEAALVEMLENLSMESRAFRFFSAGADLHAAARAAVEADAGLVALSGEEGRVVGHAMYAAGESGRAEVAFAVADDFQGRGLGTILLAHLAALAENAGIPTLEASVMPDNHRMVEVFRESGFPVNVRTEPGALAVEFPSSLSEDARERFEGRDRIAAREAVARFLEPHSVAVVGASRRRGTIGGEVFHNLVSTGFEGPVYPVNPSAEVVQSVPAWPSLSSLPAPADLAVIVVPAALVAAAVRDCAANGVRALVVISAGFAEIGGDGLGRQEELLAASRAAGMRVIGPNCMGVLNTDPAVRLNATFAPGFPPRGRIGILSQSGALGLAVIDYAESRSLGLSAFVSIGNRADISPNDLLEYWEEDPDTDLVLLYLESFGNPRKFSRIARRVGRRKPIVAVKSGRSIAGARATASHTGALLAASDVTVDALFLQAGVIRTDSLGELFDVAALLGSQPVPRGRRVAILTNAGGPGILCADACEALGLDVAELGEQTRGALASFLPAEASLVNPIDMIAGASPEDYERALAVLLEDPDVDSVITVYTPPLVTQPQEVAHAIRAAAARRRREVPLLAVFLSSEGAPPEADAPDIPFYPFPENAARALWLAVRYGEWLERPATEPPALDDVHPEEVAAIVARTLAAGGGWLGPEQVESVLRCYGVGLLDARIAASPEEAGSVAEELGGRVALKAVSGTLVHKTEAGGVAVGLSPGEVPVAAKLMQESVEKAGHRVEGWQVQQAALPGVEMLVGVVHDPLFGSLVAAGAGGTAAELQRDVAVRLTPVSRADAAEMLRSLRTYPLLEGYRGSPPTDVAALEELLVRVGALATDHPEIAELDCNPVFVGP